jgi:hypothetical protein
MPDAMRMSVSVTGVAPLLAKLHEISDPKKLERTTRESLGRAARKVIAPRIAARGSSGWKYGGHGGAYPTKGLLGQRARITARRIRTRSGEYVAIGIKPRGWAGTVEAWVVKGTRPHVISTKRRAERKGQTGVDSLARRINRGGYTGGALQIANGVFVSTVKHPGAAPTDYIHEAVQGIERMILAQLAVDLYEAMEKAARGKK